MRIWGLLIAVYALVHVTLCVNPGVKARITQNGLTYASSVAQALLATELRTLQIPNQSGKDGHIEWELTSIQNRGVTPPSSQILLDPAQNGLRWTLANLGINLHADWRIKYKKGWVKASTSGSVDLGVKQTSVSVAISLGVDQTGRPSLKTASCSSSVGDVDLDFHGGTGWIINLFKHPLEDRVKDMLQDQICKVVTNEINIDGEKALTKLKMTVEVAKRFLLDYRLIATPTVTSTYLEIQDKGEVYWEADVKEAPLTPNPIPPSSDVSRMLYLWLTDYTANTFAYAAQTHGYLKKNITKEDLPPTQDFFLNTTCNITCIGKIIPQIGQKYPNSQVVMTVTSTSMPQLAIDPKGVQVGMKGNWDMYAVLPGKAPVYMLTINMTMAVSINCSVHNEKLTGEITDDSFKFGVVKSVIGTIDPNRLNSLLNLMLKLAVIPEMNTVLGTGLDLPVTGAVKFNNTELQLLPGSVLIATDLSYIPGDTHLNTKEQVDRFSKQLLHKPEFKVVGA